MLNLKSLKSSEEIQNNFRLINDIPVQYYNLNSNTTRWNQASIITVASPLFQNATEALLYLLKKEALIQDRWKPDWNISHPDISAFTNALQIWGRFSNYQGSSILIDTFWKDFHATVTAISQQKEFEFHLNHKLVPFQIPLNKSEIIQVYCFDHNWNEHNFFIQTRINWILYSWLV